MTKPLFSILTAAYNVGPAIEIAAASVRNQNRDDIEFIVIDGASKDDTLVYVEANRDVITTVISEPDRGIYDALNKGLKAARGEIIGIIGCDDALAPGALDLIAEAHKAHKADIYAGQTLLTGSDGRGELRKDEPYGLGALISGIPFGHNAMFATRAAYDAVGLYDLSYRITADAHWVHQAILKGLQCHYIPRVLVHFADTGLSSNDGSGVLAESARAICANFPTLSDAEALDLLYGVRGWKGPEVVSAVLDRHDDPRLFDAVTAGFADRPGLLAQVMAGRTRRPGDGKPKARSGKKPSAPPPSAEPLVSFIVPAYNVDAYIHRCLDSIIGQTLTDLEIIVVDDGSTDRTAEIVALYAEQDPRVRLIRQANAGQGAARAVALREARGRYVWCVDSDDRIRARSLERIINVFNQFDDLDVVFLNFAYEDEQPDSPIEAEVPPSKWAGRVVNPTGSEESLSAVSTWSMPPWRLFIRRRLLVEQQINFESGFFYEDHPFATDVMLAARRVYIDTPISYYYLRRPGSTVRSLDRRAFDFLPIRRMVLDRYAAAGLSKRFPAMIASYIFPLDFVRAHVPPKMQREFFERAWAETSLAEREIVARYGSDDEVMLAVLCEQGRFDELSKVEATSSLSMIGRDLTVSQTIQARFLSGLDREPTWLPEAIGERRAHWVVGHTLHLQMPRGKLTAPRLVLRYRNSLDGQFMALEQQGKRIAMLPCPNGGLGRSHVTVLELAPGDPIDLTIQLARTNPDNGERSLLIDRIEVVEAARLDGLDEDALLADDWIVQPRIVHGPHTRLEAINVDVRVNPEPRTYLTIGRESHVGGTFVFERGLGEITIGNGSSVGGGTLFVCSQDKGIHIGNNVLVSWNVTFIDSNSHSADPAIRANDAYDWKTGVDAGRMGILKDWSSVRSAPIRVKDDAWIGFGSVIMKGVTIGRGAIIGSGSVVTKDVPDFAVVAGNPAQVVGRTPSAFAPPAAPSPVPAK